MIAARIIRSASPARWPTAARNTVVVSASPACWPIVARKTVVVKLKVLLRRYSARGPQWTPIDPPYGSSQAYMGRHFDGLA